MVRSDFILEARRWFVNPRERRLRAGWRLVLFVVLVGGAGIVGAVGRSELVATAAAGVVGAVVVLAGWWFYYAVLTGTAVGLAWLLDVRTLPDVGLGGDGFYRNLAVGLALGVVMTTVVFLVQLAAGLISVRGVLVARTGLGFPAGVPAWLMVAIMLVYFVAVGVGEEVLIRGYLMTNLAEGLTGVPAVGKRVAIAAAAVATSALFGILHLGNPNASPLSAFNITVVGLFFAAAYVVTDDLGIPIGIHVTWNFSLSSVYGFPVSGITVPATLVDVRETGPDLITGGGFGPEAGLVVYLALAAAAAVTWWWVAREDGAVRFREGVAVPELRRGRDVDREE
ncbi:CPBP family intramembrane glutamic endopeptidase [Halomicrobium salinisoli]|uniref:CPBP family intramembrane glutamic endopeptidase n=1 Tax=Halomicrobium salinisoli TaxID=2878391 RepID=UPI001CF07F73|nr:CPBP family intramembrane glutamic endopeptidase [Halomicrobium salinisoli]